MSALLGVPVDAAYHIVSLLTTLLTPLTGGLAAAFAIVAFTVLVRLALCPLSLRAMRGQAAMARLTPHVQALRTRYRRQSERLSRELSDLYAREGVRPASSLLPLLAQWPFLSVAYLLFRSATVGGAPNSLLAHGLLGVPLGAYWLSGAGLLGAHQAVFLAVLALLAAVCWLSARLARHAAPATAPAPAGEVTRSGGSNPAGEVKRPGKAVPATPGAAQAADAPGAARAVALIGRAAPYLTVAFAAFVPLAAEIYLVTTVAWTAAERRVFLPPSAGYSRPVATTWRSRLVATARHPWLPGRRRGGAPSGPADDRHGPGG
jgi:YidC/Oxa1 family membrane protein insertase